MYRQDQISYQSHTRKNKVAEATKAEGPATADPISQAERRMVTRGNKVETLERTRNTVKVTYFSQDKTPAKPSKKHP